MSDFILILGNTDHIRQPEQGNENNWYGKGYPHSLLGK